MEPTNRLAHEKSPYLLQHAHNPVDWYPWDEEAFAKARKEDKPIFLSIGYSTCHWCHVMAHETFEDPKAAAVMNELFVNIKVDREERPDVDRVYMTFVQATTGSGGWPMSVWLQPDLKPIVGGTYFPPDDRYGRRGFISVCRTVADAWKNQRDKVEAQGERIIGALRAHSEVEPLVVPTAAENRKSVADLLREALKPYAASFDPEYGGFGDAPKFPRPVTLALLARVHARLAGKSPAESKQAREILLATLDGMAAGGIHDHLGGGFHRYSVDRFWHVPHFEKMLYDQAQLAVAYLEAFQITGDERHASVVRDILDYVRFDLTLPGGGFFCAEDADSLLVAGRPEHAEGAFYVWTKKEVNEILTPEESARFCAFYDVHENGNAPAGSDPQGEFVGKNILYARTGDTSSDHDPLLSQASQKLLAARAKRPRPHLDDKVLTAWNGLMISAYARAFQVLRSANYLQAAERAAAFLRKNLYRETDSVLLRAYRQGSGTVEGFADDYAFLIQGLLDLYEATAEASHLHWAEQLQGKQDELFADPAGGYFSTSARDTSVLLRLKEDNDNAEPAASSVAALNLARLADLTGRDAYRQQAEKTVAAFSTAQNPLRTAQAMPLMLCALDFLADPPRQIVVVGPRDRDDTRAMLAAIYRRFVPNKVVLLADGDAGLRALSEAHPYLENATMQDGKATAYLCEGGACQLPTIDPDELARRLANQKGA